MKSTSALAIRQFVRRGPSRFGITRATKNSFVQLLREGRTLKQACKMIQASLVSVNAWRRSDPMFDRQVKEAIKEAKDEEAAETQ